MFRSANQTNPSVCAAVYGAFSAGVGRGNRDLNLIVSSIAATFAVADHRTLAGNEAAAETATRAANADKTAV